MPSFKCSACGHEYRDAHNFTVCPMCAGLGKVDEKCTCPHFRTLAGPLNLRSGTNPNCPVHSKPIEPPPTT